MAWQKKWFQFAVLLFLAFIWGSSFILMKIGLKSFSSNQAAAYRMLFASLALLPFSLKNLKLFKGKDLKNLLIAGFIGSMIPAFLFTKAQTRIDSSLAGMLNSLTPLFTFIIGVAFHKTRFSWMQVSGLLLGLVGAAGLIAYKEGFNLGTIHTFGLFVVVATICYGINVNVIKSHLTHLRGVQITSLSFMFVGPASLIYLLIDGFEPQQTDTNWSLHLLALATLGIVGTALAMLIMNSLIRYASAVFSSSVTYIIPVFAILWGILDNENITLFHLVLMGIILSGVYMINKVKG